MLNPSEISPKHIPPLQAAILNHRSKLDEHRATRLYRAARELFYNENPPPSLLQDQSMWRSRIATSIVVLASCTDFETGLFIQLAGAPKCQETGLLMTFGQKYSVEWQDTMRQNTATKIW